MYIDRHSSVVSIDVYLCYSMLQKHPLISVATFWATTWNSQSWVKIRYILSQFLTAHCKKWWKDHCPWWGMRQQELPMVKIKVKVVICIAHHRVYTPLMHFLSLTRTAGRTATMCSLQTQAGAAASQAAQSAVQRSPPSVTHKMGYYSFNWPRRDGRLSWPCWLTDSGHLTHKLVKQPSISLGQDRESSPARTDVLTTMLCHRG